jgi:protein SCO1/2
VRQKLFVIVLVLTVGLAGGSMIFGALQRQGASRSDPALLGTLWPEPRLLKGFLLMDHLGKEFGPDQLKGQWNLVFFGYTSCPDICPTTMSVLRQVQVQLGEQGRRAPRVWMVSVDPERDDPDKLGAYVSFFGDNMMGVTGTAEQTEILMRQMGAMFERGTPNDQGYYDIAHTSSVFVVDPRGRCHRRYKLRQ